MQRIAVISALNIALPLPHSPERYVALFEKVYQLRLAQKFYGEYDALIGSLRSPDEPGSTASRLVGEIYKYFRLKVDGDWYNLERIEPASPDEQRSIVIPDHLRPHFSQILFDFDVRTHILYFLSVNGAVRVGPSVVEKFFDQLFKHPSVVEEFGDVAVTVVPEADALDKVFAMPVIREITMIVRSPNPDDNSPAMVAIMNRMHELNAQKWVETTLAKTGQSLLIDDRMKSTALVAAENGVVNVKGRNSQGLVDERSTAEHPLRERFPYDDKEQSARQALASYSVLTSIALPGGGG